MTSPKFFNRRREGRSGVRWFPLLLVFSFLCPAFALAEEPYALSLAKQDAIKIDPRIRSAERELSGAEEEIRLARATNRPTLRGTSRGGYTKNQNEASNQRYEGASWNLGIDITQNIWSFGRLDARTGRAEAMYAEALSVVRRAYLEVISDVYRSYIQQLRYQMIAAEWRDLEGRLRNLEDQTRQRVSAGRASVSDLQNVQVRLFRARAERADAVASLRSARSTLAQLTGDIRQELVVKDLLLFQSLLPLDLGSAHAAAEENSVEIAEAKSRLEVARAGLDLAKADLLPSLDAKLVYNEGRIGTFKTGDSLMALQLNIPLYEGGSLRAALRQSRSVLAAAQGNLDVARERVRRSLKIEWDRLEGMGQAEQDFAQALGATEEILESVTQRLGAGRASVSEQLEAEQLLSESRVQLLLQQLDLDVARVAVLSVSGLLQPSGDHEEDSRKGR